MDPAGPVIRSPGHSVIDVSAAAHRRIAFDDSDGDPLGVLRPGYEKAAADCSVSSEPRKNTIFPSAKRHQCCMYIAAVLPVACTVSGCRIRSQAAGRYPLIRMVRASSTGRGPEQSHRGEQCPGHTAAVEDLPTAVDSAAPRIGHLRAYQVPVAHIEVLKESDGLRYK